ncbi:MAG TPA: hypothetical protein PLB38_00670 [bacterium]|nr:hypothetical protein [bacterium]
MENPTPHSTTASLWDSDFENQYFENQKILQKKWKERANKSHRIEIIFPQKEVENIRQVNLWLQQILSELERKQTENPQKYKNENYEKRVLELIMADLDKLDLWVCKFSTSSMAIHKNEDITPKETDSIYYMTPTLSCLRFKMANFKKGILHVIEPFSTTTRFWETEQKNEYPFDKYSFRDPKEGETMVVEYFYKDFLATTHQSTPIEEDYDSHLVALVDEDGFWDAPHKNGERPYHTHNGSLVNKIFFNRSKHINNK